MTPTTRRSFLKTGLAAGAMATGVATVGIACAGFALARQIALLDAARVVQGFGCAAFAFGGGDACVYQGERDVVQRRGSGEEVEGLEDEADFAVADVG